MKHPSLAVAAATLLAASVSHAQPSHQGMDMGGMKMENRQPNAGQVSLTTGEVKAVDKDGGKITLKHGAINSATVKMSPMTMAFPVKDAALLKNVKVGDTVKFTVENVNGNATVTILKPQK